ncbi:RNA-directed DNA polymerase, eukaryota, partial [Tanacetum coccineum]
ISSRDRAKGVGISLNVQGLGHKTKKEWVKELNNKQGVNFLALQETKLEVISHMDVKFLWGNSNFQFVASGSVSNSGGILCVWEESVFIKDDASISDNFIALYGTWLPTNSKILIVVIYAPQSFALKRILWDYISGLVNRWNGESIILGDFNEVRCEEERMGTIFHQQGAREFNQFISSAGLLEVKMEGYSYTWSHPSVLKMSKLDRFLVSEGMFSIFPTLSAICLDRHISTIIILVFLKKLQSIMALTPCESFHSVQTLRFSIQVARPEKRIIREWVRQSNDSKVGVKKLFWLISLTNLDKSLDSGIISDELMAKRSDLNRKLFELNQLDTKDAAQKAKIKWAIEGDENSSFFMGSINKRRRLPWSFASRFTTQTLFHLALKLFYFSKSFVPRIKLESRIKMLPPMKSEWLCGNVENAYDSVRWDFLLDVLYAFGFGSKWCQWICGIFSSNMASILVNGSPTNEFPICCGLKQGDPMAPFLFILVMESLYLSISRAITDGFFNGLHINASMSLSHLFYADDAVFLGECHVLGVGVPLEIVHQGASRIGCEVMKTPFKYIGIMVGDHMSRCSAWSNSIQKVCTRLSKWKVKTLSIAPKRVLHDMEMLRSKFFNGGDSQDCRISWVAWERVLSSKKNGALRVSSSFALNRALLLKWLWRFLSQDNSLWSYVIRAIHGPRLELHSYSTQSVWGVILREVQLLASEGFDFISWCKIRVGDGVNTMFWLDT